MTSLVRSSLSPDLKNTGDAGEEATALSIKQWFLMKWREDSGRVEEELWHLPGLGLGTLVPPSGSQLEFTVACCLKSPSKLDVRSSTENLKHSFQKTRPRKEVNNKPAYCASRNGVVRGGEDRVENPLARLAVPAARALDVVEVERVVAGQGAVQTCFQERCPP